MFYVTSMYSIRYVAIEMTIHVHRINVTINGS